MPMNGRLLRPRQTGFDPRSISGLALWLDAADSQTLYTTDAGNVTAVSAPTEISGCVGWWDASDASSITQSGGLVSQWNDKSGLGNHATASGTARPTLTASGLNGLSVMTFDGTANSMAVAANAAFNTNELTYFIVFRATSDANKGVYTKISPSAGTNGFGIATRATSPFVWLLAKNSNQPQVLAVSGVSPTTQARIYSVTSSSTASGFLDGLSAASASSAADHSLNQTVRIGSREGSEFFGGYIAEIIHFNAALSPADRARVERYLAAKWGISGVHTPATATNDPVGAWLDKSGNGRHATQATAASRPTVSATKQGGRTAVAFASSTRTVTSPATVAQHVADATTSPKMFFAWVARPEGGNAGITFGTAPTNPNSSSRVFFASDYGGFGTHIVDFGSIGGARLTGTVGDEENNAGHVYSAYRDGSVVSVRRDGVEILRKTNASGSYTATNGTLSLNTAEAGSSTASWMEFMAYAASLPAASIARLERYLAAKWGIALAPQVSNADAQDWINRVYANGGTVSAATANAVNQFCLDIENAGIRDRFFRVNLFCGNSDASLAAVRTPLFRGPSLGGTQFGNATDTNFNFGPGDYAETGASGGLTGNGSSKYLNTGLPMNFTGTRSYHLAALPFAVTSGNACFVGADTNLDGNPPRIYQSLRTFAATPRIWVWYNWTDATNRQADVASNSVTGSLLLGTGDASGNTLYSGGSAVATTAATENRTATQTFPHFVFAENRRNQIAAEYLNGRLGLYSAGLAMTASQVASYNAAVVAFNAAMGRT